MNFMFPVPDASLEAVEICSLTSAAAKIISALEYVYKRQPVYAHIISRFPLHVIKNFDIFDSVRCNFCVEGGHRMFIFYPIVLQT